MNFTCSVSHVGDSATVTPRGDIDVAATPSFRASLQTALAAPGVGTILVDMAGVAFIDSTAIGALVAGHTAADRQGTAFRVINPGPMVTMVLTITGLIGI